MEYGVCDRRLRKGFILMLLMLVCFVLPGRIACPETVYAAQSAPKEELFAFQDQSGKYLQKMRSNWYLYDREGRKLTGVQYLSIPRTGNLSSGYYMFDKKGALVQRPAVYYLKKQTVKGVVFQGYHYTNGTGRFLGNAQGWRYLSNLKCEGRVFSGYYYLDAYGRLSNKAQVRYMPAKRLHGVSFRKGYYFFNKYGKLCTKADFHALNQKVNGRRFKGEFYFGDKNGRLLEKAGWVTVKKQRYFINANGKKKTNGWKSGYYLQADGTIAKMKKVPDGSYVDINGRKCARKEMKLSGLRDDLQKILGRYLVRLRKGSEDRGCGEH